MTMLQRLDKLAREQPELFRSEQWSEILRDLFDYPPLWERFDMLRWVHDRLGRVRVEMKPWAPRLILKSGSVDAVAWLLDRFPAVKSDVWLLRSALPLVAARGQTDLFQWLDSNVAGIQCVGNTMDLAAASGELALVKYLHSSRYGRCTNQAMDMAARRGHLEVVRFLHRNRSEGCSVNALRAAVIYGHLQVVAYLHTHYHEHCDANLLAIAVRAKQSVVVKYLLRACSEHQRHEQ